MTKENKILKVLVISLILALFSTSCYALELNSVDSSLSVDGSEGSTDEEVIDDEAETADSNTSTTNSSTTSNSTNSSNTSTSNASTSTSSTTSVSSVPSTSNTDDSGLGLSNVLNILLLVVGFLLILLAIAILIRMKG